MKRMKRILSQVLNNYADLVRLIAEIGLDAAPAAEAMQLPSVSEIMPEISNGIEKIKAPKLIKAPKAKKEAGFKNTGTGITNSKFAELTDESIAPSFFNGTKPCRAEISIDGKQPSIAKPESWAKLLTGVIFLAGKAGLAPSEMSNLPGLGTHGLLELTDKAVWGMAGINKCVTIDGKKMVTPSTVKIDGKNYAFSTVSTTDAKVKGIRALRTIMQKYGSDLKVDVELA